MIKKKILIVLITAMIMTSSLTACQKIGDETDNGNDQTEETMEEITDEKEVSDTEQEMLQQH